jgi:hypothetical protein
MSNLAKVIAKVIEARVTGALEARDPEVRLIFHGPPGSTLEQAFELLAGDAHPLPVPVLLQVPTLPDGITNPGVGQSGRCTEDHLLDLRNSSTQASYVALVPPGQHSSMSVSTTSDEFGMLAANNAGNVSFEQWWSDDFLQTLIERGIEGTGLKDKQAEQTWRLVSDCVAAADDADEDRTLRRKAWHAIARLFEAWPTQGAPSGQLVALACGVPPQVDGTLDYRAQSSILAKLGEVLAGGLSSGLADLAEGATDEERVALDAFLAHLRASCDLPTMFERAPSAYYAPFQGPSLGSPPRWWAALTVERWQELLTEDAASKGDLEVAVHGLLAPAKPGSPALVSGPVRMTFSAKGDEPSHALVTVERTPAGGAKLVGSAEADSGEELVDPSPPLHWSPLRYTASAEAYKPASGKVISLASWGPGVYLVARHARKVSPPRRRKGRSGPEFEATMIVEGAGRYEVAVFTSPGVELDIVTSAPDGAVERGEAPTPLKISPQGGGMCLVDVEVEGSHRLDLGIIRREEGRRPTSQCCRVAISMEEVDQAGCRSEFERLVRANRRTLDPAEGRLQVRLDRNPRIATLEEWILSEELVLESYRPLVVADDLEDAWAKPSWAEPGGPIISNASFIKDPRPTPSEFLPPPGFLVSRAAIAARIRGEDQSGLAESAALGQWLSDDQFRADVEAYLQSYSRWLEAEPDIACWVDTVLITSIEGDRTLSRSPDAVFLSPLHPIRLAWQALAQQELRAAEATCPCPSASVLDPDCVPDLLHLAVRVAGGTEQVPFVSVENGTDYWSVLWNSKKLKELPSRSRRSPFGSVLGVSVGGIAVGFSAAQVERALDDVYDLLAAKPVTAVTITSSGGTTDASNQGLIDWCKRRYLDDQARPARQSCGPRLLEVYDKRDLGARPDHATIANLAEDTRNQVKWFDDQPIGTVPDLGIIAQLDMSDPSVARVRTRTALGHGGLARHRVRRQLPDNFISESRQSVAPASSGEPLADKLASCVGAIESIGAEVLGLNFVPNVNAVRNMLDTHKADFVAVSSSAIDPAAFLGDWLDQTYLWDYELPSYSRRAGDTNGYYLLSRVKEADREALASALARLPGCAGLPPGEIQSVLQEVARRGIPTVKGLAGDDAGTTGDLGLFLAVRLLQDRFRVAGPLESLLPVLEGAPTDARLAIIIPVDPFLAYLSDLGRALGLESPASRPDLLVAGISLRPGTVRIHLTPIEVKCRPEVAYPPGEMDGALAQARNMSNLLTKLLPHEGQPRVWALGFQHLLMSMIGFGLRVYSQHRDVVDPEQWSAFHEAIAASVLGGECAVTVDQRGRLIVVDASGMSKPIDKDGDGFEETVVISRADAATMVKDDPAQFYNMVRAKLGYWCLFPPEDSGSGAVGVSPEVPLAGVEGPNDPGTPTPPDPSLEFRGDDPGQPPERSGGATKDAHTDALVPAVSKTSPSAADGVGDMHKAGVILHVGRTVDGFVPRSLELNISDTRLNHLNMGVVGDLGTGKTQLLKSIILQISRARGANRGIAPRFLIFDYKRDYSSDDFVRATGARVVRPERLPLNLFDTSTMEQAAAPWLQRFRFFADVLDKIYPGIGPVQRDKLKKAVRAAYDKSEGGNPPTLYDIHATYTEMVEGKADSILAIIEDLVDMEVFAPSVEQTIPFDQFLDGVVVIALDALGQDDRSKNMLVAVMLNLFYENMLRSTKRPFLGTDPQLRAIDSYLLVDEADNIMRYEFDVLRKLLLQGREFGTGVILASQYLRHFKVNATDYRDPLLTWFVHKVPNVSAGDLSALGLASSLGDLAERVKTLKNHECLYKSYDVPGEVIRGLPFFEIMNGG